MPINNIMMMEMANLWRKWIFPNLTEALEKTPEDKLDWAPGAQMLTFGLIFLHIAECSDWWYDDIMLGKESIELAFEDKPSVLKDQIAIHLKEHQERMERFFAETPETFEKTYHKQLQSRKIERTGYWIFMHLFEHDIHHRSQINQYLRILEIEPPQI